MLAVRGDIEIWKDLPIIPIKSPMSSKPVIGSALVDKPEEPSLQDEHDS